MLFTLPGVTVTGANTATVFSSTQQFAHSVIIFNSATSAALVWIGDSLVSSTSGSERGFPVAIGAIYTLVDEGSPNGFDLSKLYFASVSGSSKIFVSYTQE